MRAKTPRRAVEAVSALPYRAGVDSALYGSGLPYGYAITIWSSGQMLIDRHGSPAPDSIFLFAAGAAAAWGLLKILTSGASTASELQLSGSPHLVRAGAVHVTAIGCAIGASALIGLISTAVVFPAAAFTATLVYLGVVGLEMSLLERELAAEPAQDGRSAQ